MRSISTTRYGNSEFHLTAVLGETNLSTTEMIPSLHSGNGIDRAGDILTNLSVSESTLYECLLIHRVGGYCRSGNMIELAWVPNVAPFDCNRELPHAEVFVQPVTDIFQTQPYEAVEHEKLGQSSEYKLDQGCPCRESEGLLLKNGMRYFVYRVLLYSDGFSQYKDAQGSAGGVYMLPLNLLPRDRTSRKAVRLLSLTPPGVSTSQALKIVCNDIAGSGTTGIDTFDGDGVPIKVFVQAVAYIGDFLEIAHISDLLGHNADSACHLCFFRKQKLDPYRSAHGYTTELNCTDTSSFRSEPRMKAIRESNGTDKDRNRLLNHLGMESASSRMTCNSPLRTLNEMLNDARSSQQVPLSTCGHPIFEASFDPYRSVLVAPDHLLSGNAINILNTCFLMITFKGTKSSNRCQNM